MGTENQCWVLANITKIGKPSAEVKEREREDFHEINIRQMCSYDNVFSHKLNMNVKLASFETERFSS